TLLYCTSGPPDAKLLPTQFFRSPLAFEAELLRHHCRFFVSHVWRVFVELRQSPGVYKTSVVSKRNKKFPEADPAIPWWEGMPNCAASCSIAPLHHAHK